MRKPGLCINFPQAKASGYEYF